jgi:hypothetical protein
MRAAFASAAQAAEKGLLAALEGWTIDDLARSAVRQGKRAARSTV